MKISQLFLGLVACSTAFAYAGIDGISSNESNIKIGLLPMQAIRVV